MGTSHQDLVSKIEEALFPVMQYIIQNDVTEFLPYIFQVLSLALEYRKDGVKGPYMELFPLLLQPVLWERTGIINYICLTFFYLYGFYDYYCYYLVTLHTTHWRELGREF